MAFFYSNQVQEDAPAISFQSFAELYTAFGRITPKSAPVLSDDFIFCKLPAGSIIVDCIVDIDNMWSGGTGNWGFVLYFLGPNGFAPISDTQLILPLVVPGGSTFRGYMAKTLTPAIKDRMSRAFYADVYAGAFLAGVGTTWQSGARVSLDLLFRAALSSEY